MKFVPHRYQQYCIDAIERIPSCALWLDMGLGKTVVTLSALYELKYLRFSIRRALVIAPKKVAENTWSAEADKWDHLSDLRVCVVLGSAGQREEALRRPADVYVINRENTQWLVRYFGNRWPFDVVVLDESSSFKNHQAKRFRALKAVRPKITRMIELTGTPSPHGLMDLWAQIYLLDGGRRLGRTISAYRDIYFVPDKRSRTTIFSYAPKDGSADAIYRQLSDICISMKSEDYLELPDMVVNNIPVVLDPRSAKAYKDLESDMLLRVADESAEDGEENVITAVTAAALTGKLLQLCNGAVYDEDGSVVPIHDCKMDVFLETVEQLSGQHVRQDPRRAGPVGADRACVYGSGRRESVERGRDRYPAGAARVLRLRPQPAAGRTSCDMVRSDMEPGGVPAGEQEAAQAGAAVSGDRAQADRAGRHGRGRREIAGEQRQVTGCAADGPQGEGRART